MTVSELRRLLAHLPRSAEVRIASVAEGVTQFEVLGLRSTFDLLHPPDQVRVVWVIAGQSLGVVRFGNAPTANSPAS